MLSRYCLKNVIDVLRIILPKFHQAGVCLINKKTQCRPLDVSTVDVDQLKTFSLNFYGKIF